MEKQIKDEDIKKLIEKVKKNDEGALNKLFVIYAPLINQNLNYFYPILRVHCEKDDIRQEIDIAFHRAILRYDEEKGVTLGAYASKCIRNALVSKVRFFNGKKRSRKNQVDDGAVVSHQNASLEEEISYLKKVLTKFEYQVLEYKIIGYKPREISKKMDIDVKKVYNALCRAKNKASSDKLS